MRRNIYMLLSLLTFMSFTSCVIESYEKPAKTSVGYNLALSATFSLSANASMADVARVSQMWRNAATEQEKYDIEDKYLGRLKIRQIGDTISIMDMCKINTFGHTLSDSYWEIFMANGMNRKITLVDSGKMKVESINAEDGCNLTVEFIGNGEEYLVAGYGDVRQNPDYVSKFLGLSYSVTSPIRFIPPSVHSSFWFFGEFEAVSGTLEIKVHEGSVELEGDKTIATYLPDNCVEIQIHGFKDHYNEFYWNR